MRRSIRLFLSPCLAAFLAGCGERSSLAQGTDGPALALVATRQDGAALYQQRCVACHQMTGEGLPGMYPPLARSEIVNGQASIPIRIVLRGLQGPITVRGKKYDGVMPPFGLSIPMADAEVAAVLTYVRRSFGNASGPVSDADVATERAATAKQTTPWTAKDLGIP